MRSTFKKLLLTAALGSAMAIFAGCGDTITNTTQATVVPGTLQGKVMDATTGKAIVNDPTLPADNIKMYLIVGSETRSADKADFSTTSDLAGEYAFNNIPVTQVDGIVAGPNATYKLVVVKKGYQRFESEFSFEGDSIKNPGANDPTLVYDGKYLKIGNIYLYPTGATAANYSLSVNYNSKAVPGAVVQLTQNINSNVAIAQQQGGTNGAVNAVADTHRLLPSLGLMPTLSATTDADGKVVFNGTDLVLGGQYIPTVLPVKTPVADGAVQLARTNGAVFTVGAAGVGTASAISQTIIMNDAVPGDAVAGLFIASASNSTAGALTGVINPGVLTLTFNRPVVLNGVTPTATAALGFGATLGFAGTAVLNPTTTTAVATPTKRVIASLSADGLTLTLTPSFATTPAVTNFNLQVTFDDGTATVSPAGQPDQLFSIFGAVAGAAQLRNASGATISPTVHIVGPQ